MEVVLRLLVEGHYLDRRELFTVARTCRTLAQTCLPMRNRFVWIASAGACRVFGTSVETTRLLERLFVWRKMVQPTFDVLADALSRLYYARKGRQTLARCYNRRAFMTISSPVFDLEHLDDAMIQPKNECMDGAYGAPEQINDQAQHHLAKPGYSSAPRSDSHDRLWRS